MTIIRGRAGSGRTHELVRRFITDEKSATLITDRATLHDIVDIINRLQKQGYDINKDRQKNIETMQFISCDTHYHKIVRGIGSTATVNLYLDIRMPDRMRSHILSYCKCLEDVHGVNITISEQLPADSDVSGLQFIHA